MKEISRRLSRLEQRFVPNKEQGPNLAEILRERYRRRMEQSGQSYVEEPPDLTDYRGLSIAEILRSRFKRMVKPGDQTGMPTRQPS